MPALQGKAVARRLQHSGERAPLKAPGTRPDAGAAPRSPGLFTACSLPVLLPTRLFRAPLLHSESGRHQMTPPPGGVGSCSSVAAGCKLVRSGPLGHAPGAHRGPTPPLSLSECSSHRTRGGVPCSCMQHYLFKGLTAPLLSTRTATCCLLGACGGGHELLLEENYGDHSANHIVAGAQLPRSMASSTLHLTHVWQPPYAKAEGPKSSQRPCREVPAIMAC